MWTPEGGGNYLQQVHCLHLLKTSPEQGWCGRGNVSASWVILTLKMSFEAQKSTQEPGLTPLNPPLQSGSPGLGKCAAILVNLGRFQHVLRFNNQVSAYQHSLKRQILSINLPNKFISQLYGLERGLYTQIVN